MSHSIRGSKGPGFEYWTARPFNKCGGTLSPNGGKFHKKRTHKAERQIGRAEIRATDAFEDVTLYRCTACGWLDDERATRFYWCVECDEWTEHTPVIYRPKRR